MSEQAEQDWWETDMDTTKQEQVKARLNAAIADVERAALRAGLARASRSHYPQATDQS